MLTANIEPNPTPRVHEDGQTFNSFKRCVPFILVADSLTWHEIFNLMGGCNWVTFWKSFVLFPIVISGDADTAEPAQLELSTKIHKDFTVYKDNLINKHLSMVCIWDANAMIIKGGLASKDS